MMNDFTSKRKILQQTDNVTCLGASVQEKITGDIQAVVGGGRTELEPTLVQKRVVTAQLDSIDFASAQIFNEPFSDVWLRGNITFSFHLKNIWEDNHRNSLNMKI